jgi:hypothetical protein
MTMTIEYGMLMSILSAETVSFVFEAATLPPFTSLHFGDAVAYGSKATILILLDIGLEIFLPNNSSLFPFPCVCVGVSHLQTMSIPVHYCTN